MLATGYDGSGSNTIFWHRTTRSEFKRERESEVDQRYRATEQRGDTVHVGDLETDSDLISGVSSD